MHFGLSQADLLKFRKSAWLGPIWIGLAQADFGSAYSNEYPSGVNYLNSFEGESSLWVSSI